MDPAAVIDAERARWDDAAPRWARWRAPLEAGARAVSDAMLEAARLRPGARVLDLATGLGELASRAAGEVAPDGSVIAVDLAPSMIAVARERAEASVDFRVLDIGSVGSLPGPFDAVLCRWGLMFVPDLDAALRAVRSVVAPGARFSAAVWSRPEAAPMIGVPASTARRVLALPEPSPGAVSPFSLASPGSLEGILDGAGFRTLVARAVPVVVRFASVDELVRFWREISGSLRAALADRPEAEIDLVEQALREEARRYLEVDGSIALRNEARLVVAEAV